MPNTTYNPPALAITERFFTALDLALRLGKIKCLSAFCKKHHLNRSKYSTLKNGAKIYKTIDLDALSAICTDFGVSPTWLLLGKGKMLADENTSNT